MQQVQPLYQRASVYLLSLMSNSFPQCPHRNPLYSCKTSHTCFLVSGEVSASALFFQREPVFPDWSLAMFVTLHVKCSLATRADWRWRCKANRNWPAVHSWQDKRSISFFFLPWQPAKLLTVSRTKVQQVCYLSSSRDQLHQLTFKPWEERALDSLSF